MTESDHPRADQRVPPEAVRAPRTIGRADLRPEHLYKAVGLLFLFAIFFHYLTSIMEVLLLMYAAVILAVLFNGIVHFFPLHRKWIAAALGLLILVGFGALLYLGLPMLVEQIRDIARRGPEFTSMLQRVEQWVQSSLGMEVQLVGPQARQMAQDIFFGGGRSNIMSRATGLIGVLLLPLLILFGALYAVAKPNEQLLSPLLRAVPRDRRLAFRRIFQLLGERLLGWLKALVLAMVGVGLLSLVLYWVIGMPNAMLLALVAGLTEAIPILGPWIGGLVAVSVALLDDPTKALWVAGAAIVVQQVESNLITPFAMSRAAEVHPFVTLFALVLFGTMFGFLGVLLSIPIVLLIATVIEVLWIERAIDTDRDPIAPVVRE